MNKSVLSRVISFFAQIGIRLWLSIILAIALFLAILFMSNYSFDYGESKAQELSKKLEERLLLLDSFMQQAIDGDHNSWLSYDDFPKDMLIYRYCKDSLQSWINQFPSLDDDVTRPNVLKNSLNSRFSPLMLADSTWRYYNIGSSWYLIKEKVDNKNCRILAALEIKHIELNNVSNGINPLLDISEPFQIYPISYSTGIPVYVYGKPVMKLIQEDTFLKPLITIPSIVWLALIIIVLVVIFYLTTYRSLHASLLALILVFFILFFFYIAGRALASSSLVFSPSVYAWGSIYYSLAALLIINASIFCFVLYIYISRFEIYKFLSRKKSRSINIVVAIFSVLILCSLCSYIYITFKSVILNSNINVDLYQIEQIDAHTILVYLSYISLFIAIALILQIIRVLFYKSTYKFFNLLSGIARMVFALISAFILVLLSGIWTLEREKSSANIWANEMAINRDIAFELQLRNIETLIAQDGVISRLLNDPKDYKLVKSRILENYISSLSQDYEVSVYLYNNPNNDYLIKFFQERIVEAKEIAKNSSFYYSQGPTGMARYTAMFVYPTNDKDFVSILIAIDAKYDNSLMSYASLLKDNSSSKINLPERYSFAKYLNHNLVAFRGEYAYSTILLPEVESLDNNAIEVNDYLHFVNRISDRDTIIISRQKTDFMQYAMSLCVLTFFLYISISVFSIKRKKVFSKNYYRSRINSVLFFSLLSTLILLAIISVIFVYKKNNTNVRNLMISKINILQSLVEAGTRDYDSFDDFYDLKIDDLLRDISHYAKIDINLYSPSGKIYQSTYPKIFETMLLGARIDHEAYKQLVYGNRRFFINEEIIQGKKYYCMYAPIFNTKGRLIAIMSAPYTDDRLNFSRDAATHMFFILTLFFLLLISSRALTTKIVDKMFIPLLDMGDKMNAAKTRALEHIHYEREDELSSLVHSYNDMVDALAESTERLAVAERDKAWREMARQVAHEIKTPLTPIKLQIQRIIRLKNNKTEAWEEKFDAILPVIISSIDQLSDTANDFSNFAKLYSEEFVEIDLRKMAEDNISLFDEHDNIKFEYIGLESAIVMGPKPQLNRVFVNMLTNAVQAITNYGMTLGMVRLSVRNSMKDAFYEVVFEDNGPGVSEDNQPRLFTPNFTTKNGGSGLGLAICRNIIDVCGGEIKYSKSFDLNGACFTITIPKKL